MPREEVITTIREVATANVETENLNSHTEESATSNPPQFKQGANRVRGGSLIYMFVQLCCVVLDVILHAQIC